MRDTLRQAVLMEIPPYDPFGGPAYGQRDMPFAVIGGAIASAVGSAFAAGAGAAAALGATAGGAIATAAGVVSAVGLVATWVGVGLTVVGAVTGNTDLMKIGGYVGLAGGVTGLAVSGINAAFSTAATTLATETAYPTVTAVAKHGLEGLSSAAPAQAAQPAATTAAAAPTPTSTGILSTSAPPIQSAPITQAGATAPGVSAAQSTANTALSGTQNAASGGVDQILGEINHTATAGLDETLNTVRGVGNNVGGQGLVGESASFFGKLSKLDGIMNIGGEVLKGMAAGGTQDDMLDLRRSQLELDRQRLALEQKKIGYDQMSQERAYKNANTQGRLNVRTRELTPEEKAAAAAKRQRNMTQPYTQPAK